MRPVESGSGRGISGITSSFDARCVLSISLCNMLILETGEGTGRMLVLSSGVDENAGFSPFNGIGRGIGGITCEVVSLVDNGAGFEVVDVEAVGAVGAAVTWLELEECFSGPK